jgi:hypothetical protein
MARLTITATAATLASQLAALEEAIAVLTPALATLVADGASPTQAHVTAVNNAWTTISTILTNDFVVYYNRSTVSTQTLVKNLFNATCAMARSIS